MTPLSPLTLLATATGIPLTAVIWYPDWLWLALIVAAPFGVAAFRRTATQPKVKAGWTERRPFDSTRWLPGIGVGVSLLRWPPRPYAWLGLWRWRR